MRKSRHMKIRKSTRNPLHSENVFIENVHYEDGSEYKDRVFCNIRGHIDIMAGIEYMDQDGKSDTGPDLDPELVSRAHLAELPREWTRFTRVHLVCVRCGLVRWLIMPVAFTPFQETDTMIGQDADMTGERIARAVMHGERLAPGSYKADRTIQLPKAR